MRVGVVTGREIKPNKNGNSNVVLLQVVVSDDDDVQTVELIGSDEFNPVDGTKVLLVDITPSWVVAVAADDLIPPEIDVGERRIYSSDGVGRKATILWKNNGQLELNGKGDFAVRFSKLEEGFNQLVADFNNHSGHSIGSTPTASTASIADAKIDSIEVPS